MEILNTISQQLNNREIAIVSWGIVCIFLALLNTGIRKSFGGVLKSLFSGEILAMVLLNTLIFFGIIYGLHRLGLWQNFLWKDAIFWWGTSFVMLFNANKALEEDNYYKKEFLKLLKLEAILIFFLSLYTFSLLTEIIFIPIWTLLILVQVTADLQKEHKSIGKGLATFNGSIVLFLIGYSLKEFLVDPEQTLNLQNLISFVFPIGLTIFYIPLLYILSLYMIYESFFIRLECFLKKDFNLKNKLRIFKTCKLSVNSVKKFQEQSLQKDHIRSESDLLETIKNFKKINS